ncbi:MAG TPA: tripartite tricarboxylate transporter substrate binding protein [Gammaproteobacteria bacterium]|nr:tripartite tricarboxylate transporter substrate binding protein [Gammaproteobacteria bacterium]
MAQDNYPSRPIRLVVPSAAGSAQDIVVRLLQPHLEKSFKQPIVIENRSGASTTLGADAVARATPDGYTLLVEPTTFTVNAALTKKLPYDIERDFEPVALLVKNPLLLAINSKLPARSLIEFLDLAKASRGKFNYATPGAASQAHLLIEMLSARANIKMQHVPYRGGGPAALSVAAGETELTLLSPVVLQSHMQSGAVRALATGGMTRDSQFPDLPTIAESGFSDFQAVQWLGLLTTGRTPKAIVQKLNREVNRILANPQIASRLASQGTTPAGGSPDEFRQLIAAELKNWKDVAQRANIKAK